MSTCSDSLVYYAFTISRGDHVLANLIFDREVFRSWKGSLDTGGRVWIFIWFQKKKFYLARCVGKLFFLFLYHENFF